MSVPNTRKPQKIPVDQIAGGQVLCKPRVRAKLFLVRGTLTIATLGFVDFVQSAPKIDPVMQPLQ